MVGCETTVKRISCRVINSAPFDAGMRKPRVNTAYEQQSPVIGGVGSDWGFVSPASVDTYSFNNGSFRLVFAKNNQGESLDCFA